MKTNQYDIQQLLIENYESIQARGMITERTTPKDFFEKLKEEFMEWSDSNYEDKEELVDIILVAFNALIHDCTVPEILKIIKGKIEVNKTRAKYGL